MTKLKALSENQKFKKFLQTVKERMISAEISTSSAAIAYYLLLSIFPLVIAIGNILPFLRINPTTTLPYIEAIFPPSIYHLLEGTIRSLLSKANGGLLSVSAIATVWAASRSINALQTSLNKVYGVKKRRNLLITRLFSFVVIFVFLIAIVLIAIAFAIGQNVLEYLLPILNFPADIPHTFGTLKWPVTVFILFITMLLIYFIIPNAKVPFRSVLPGAIFATIGWMTLTQLFGLYTKYFAKGVSSYGILGSFIVFMIWLNLTSIVIIIGGVINAVNEEYVNGGITSKPSFIENVIEDKISVRIKGKEEE